MSVNGRQSPLTRGVPRLAGAGCVKCARQSAALREIEDELSLLREEDSRGTMWSMIQSVYGIARAARKGVGK